MYSSINIDDKISNSFFVRCSVSRSIKVITVVTKLCIVRNWFF